MLRRSINGQFLSVVNNDHLDGALLREQSQAELLLDG
jgi:hypothetical protein